MDKKTNSWLEMDFAEFLGLGRVMTPVEIDELTDRLNDELFLRTKNLSGEEIVNASVAVKKEFVFAYLNDLLEDYSQKQYGDPKKIEPQFQIVRKLRELLAELKKEQQDFQKAKILMNEINVLLIEINTSRL